MGLLGTSAVTSATGSEIRFRKLNPSESVSSSSSSLSSTTGAGADGAGSKTGVLPIGLDSAIRIAEMPSLNPLWLSLVLAMKQSRRYLMINISILMHLTLSNRLSITPRVFD